MERHEGGYYIRLVAVDRPGSAATIARRMADENISLESIVQRHPTDTAALGNDKRDCVRRIQKIDAAIQHIAEVESPFEIPDRSLNEAITARKILHGHHSLT